MRKEKIQDALNEVYAQWSDMVYQIERLIEWIESGDVSKTDSIIKALRDILDED